MIDRKWKQMLLAPALVCAIAAAMGSAVIRDEAKVLSDSDRKDISAAADKLSYPLTVWTVNGGFADKPAFLKAADNVLDRNGALIAVDVNAKDRYSHVAARERTGLNKAQMDKAKAAAVPEFTKSNWGGGIAASINSLATAAPVRTGPAAAPAGTVRSTPTPTQKTGVLGTIGWIPIIVIGLVIIFALKSMSRRTNYGPGYGQPNQGGPYPPQGGPYPQGGQYPQGGPYPGQGYPPNYQQPTGRGGAGLLGALGGGIVGYELGKHMGGGHDQGSGNWGGGGAVPGNSGDGIVESDAGGSGADFGGGGADFGGGGGGADFGGGGADFGGGGADFGGGDIGGDSGGGGADF